MREWVSRFSPPKISQRNQKIDLHSLPIWSTLLCADAWILVVVPSEEVTGLTLGGDERVQEQTPGLSSGNTLLSLRVDSVASLTLEAANGVDSVGPGGASPGAVSWEGWSCHALAEGGVWDATLTGETVPLLVLEVAVLAACDGGWDAGFGLLEPGVDGGFLPDEVARLADHAVVAVLPSGAVGVLGVGGSGAAVAESVVSEAC